MLKKDLKKWQYGFSMRAESEEKIGFDPNITAYFLKLIALPEWGEALGKKHYRGFFINFYPLRHFTVILQSRTVKIGRKYWRFYYPIQITFHK